MIRYRAQGSSISQIVGTQIAVGIGGGMLNVPAQLGVQASATHQEVAAVTAIFLTIVEIGGAVGSAISGAVWTANIPKKLALYLPDNAKGDALKIFGSLPVATAYAMNSPERIAINRAYQETMNILLIISICVAAPLIPLSLLMRNYKLDQVRTVISTVSISITDTCNTRLTNVSRARSSDEASIAIPSSEVLEYGRAMGCRALRSRGITSVDDAVYCVNEEEICW